MKERAKKVQRVPLNCLNLFSLSFLNYLSTCSYSVWWWCFIFHISREFRSLLYLEGKESFKKKGISGLYLKWGVPIIRKILPTISFAFFFEIQIIILRNFSLIEILKIWMLLLSHLKSWFLFLIFLIIKSYIKFTMHLHICELMELNLNFFVIRVMNKISIFIIKPLCAVYLNFLQLIRFVSL